MGALEGRGRRLFLVPGNPMSTSPVWDGGGRSGKRAEGVREVSDLSSLETVWLGPTLTWGGPPTFFFPLPHSLSSLEGR